MLQAFDRCGVARYGVFKVGGIKLGVARPSLGAPELKVSGGAVAVVVDGATLARAFEGNAPPSWLGWVRSPV